MYAFIGSFSAAGNRLYEEKSSDPEMLIDLKSSVWFPLGSEDETMFFDTKNFFQLDCRSRC